VCAMTFYWQDNCFYEKNILTFSPQIFFSIFVLICVYLFLVIPFKLISFIRKITTFHFDLLSLNVRWIQFWPFRMFHKWRIQRFFRTSKSCSKIVLKSYFTQLFPPFFRSLGKKITKLLIINCLGLSLLSILSYMYIVLILKWYLFQSLLSQYES